MYYLFGAMALFFGEEKIKQWFEKNFNLNQEKKVLKEQVILTKHHNYGFIHNRCSDNRSRVLWVSVAGILFVLGNACAAFFSQINHVLKAGMMLLLAGGTSNAYDRMKRGYVVDYFIINKGRLKKTIFNLADIMLFFGTIFCIMGSVFFKKGTI